MKICPQPLAKFFNQVPFPLNGNNQPPVIIWSPNTYLQQAFLNPKDFPSLLIYFAAYLIHMYWWTLTKCWQSVKHSKQTKISQPHNANEIIIIKDIVHMHLPLSDSQFTWIVLVVGIILFWYLSDSRSFLST